VSSKSRWSKYCEVPCQLESSKDASCEWSSAMTTDALVCSSDGSSTVSFLLASKPDSSAGSVELSSIT
jgi:hypothetical protein